MKKIKVIIVLLSLLLTGFVSCVEKGDFDTNKISLNELHPTFFLPLIQDTLTLNSQPNISHEGDTSGFLYTVDNIQLPSKDGWFSIPNVNVNLPLSYTAGTGDVDETLPALSFPLLPDDGRELDSLLCSGLPVKITFSGLPSLNLVEVIFPQIFVNGQPYTANVTTTTDVNIPACKIVPKDKKLLEVQVRLQGTIPAFFNTNLNIQIQDIQNYYTALFGYFGQETVTVKDTVELNIMDDLNITATSLEFDVLKVVAQIQNSMGIPFRLTLDNIKAYGKNGQLLATEYPNKIMDVLAPGYTDPMANTPATIRCERFGHILQMDTRKIVFSFTCTSNPEGKVKRNFLRATDIIQPIISIRIPLFVKAEDLVLRDTIDISMSSISLEELKLQMNFKNSLPVAAKLNVWLLKEDDTPFSTPLIDNLTIAQPSIVNGIATDVIDLQQSLSISKTLFDQLKKSTQALAIIDVGTGTDYVKFMKDNSLYLKIGAEAKFKYEELLK
jgi:hypothetical protein